MAPNPTAGQRGILDDMVASTLTFGSPPFSFNPLEHHAENFYNGSRSPAMYIFFNNGAHINWIMSDSLEERISKPAGVAWLLRHLKNMVGPDIEMFLPPLSSDITMQSK